MCLVKYEAESKKNLPLVVLRLEVNFKIASMKQSGRNKNMATRIEANF